MLQPALLCLASVASQCPKLSLAVPARDAANTLQVSLSGWSVPQVRCHSPARPTCRPNRRTGTLGRLRWSGAPPRTARRRSTPSSGSPSRPTRVPPPGRPSHPLPAALCASASALALARGPRPSLSLSPRPTPQPEPAPASEPGSGLAPTPTPATDPEPPDPSLTADPRPVTPPQPLTAPSLAVTFGPGLALTLVPSLTLNPRPEPGRNPRPDPLPSPRPTLGARLARGHAPRL